MSLNQDDIVRSSLEWTGLDNELRVNVWHIQYQSAPVLPDLTAVADIGLYLASFYNSILAFLTTSLTSVRVVNKNITQDLLMPDHIPAPGIDGASAADPLPPQVAALIIGRTLKSRVQRRIYIPGNTESGVTAGKWTAAYLTGLATAAAQLTVPAVINGSTYQAVAYNEEFGTHTFITSALAIEPARTQRRRSFGFGA